MAGSKDIADKYSREMFVRQEQYARRVKAYYDHAVERLLELARQVKDDASGKAFRFADNIGVRDEATVVIRQLYSRVYQEIRAGVEAEWEYANLSCDAMVASAFGEGCMEQDAFARLFERNRRSMDQFFKRKNSFGGLSLSQKVWKYTGDLRTELENAVTVSLGEGVSASTMSRRVRQYLQEPERLYRRVRSADGKLRLSKAAKAFHPGQGVYRSSYKNAMRLARTETNAAYRLADEDRWQRMDFVVGMRISKSNNHPSEDVCDILCGDYPKDFKFSAWHPQCRCYVVPILCTREEMIQMQRNILSGNDAANAGFRSVNEVRTVPKAFRDWVDTNNDRIMRAKALPYFLRDNIDRVNRILGKESALDSVIKTLTDAKVEYLTVEKLHKQLSETEIISRVGGGDLTKGSCSSLAFAYAGNVCGFDVLDFRDGVSRSMFSRSSVIMDIAEKVGGIVVEHTDDFRKAKDLLKNTKDGRMYYFTCGAHAAVVRRVDGVLEYLELQSSTSNGFKPLNTDILKRRFGAKKSHTFGGRKYQTKDCIIDIEVLKNNNGFRKMLGYINTEAKKQRKGMGGSEK
ncbi:MAG: hypothetical protein NC344_10135 [Bacteroidales bacterium]|nr:hypothetical protein [Bacteroidales bacterium]MCM1148162.1 hypothetical protein [Bacteroidales bacterium]MCM1207111.1 hypothetical protein [Bacillota bacterium]MCM1510863.1 hypothetical protein [Clostridium sp.]